MPRIKTKEKIFKKDRKLPSLEELSDDYELHVVEKKTGKKISSLSNIEDLSITKDLKLSVRSAEKKEWEKILSPLKAFSQNQINEFNKKIKHFKESIPRDEICNIINSIEAKNSPSLQKIPINLFNVLLTNKSQTLNKIGKRIGELKTKLKNEKTKSRAFIIKRQIAEAENVRNKAEINFPESFKFSVYEHYAIFGGLKLLFQNKFKPIEMYFSNILEVLEFDQINKKEISEIKKAFVKLTKQKFPCYIVRPDPDNPNKYIFYDGDEPIFKIRETGMLDLDLELSSKDIVKKKLWLSLENPALLNDMDRFYVIIHGNILAELRKYKKVRQEDLYFIEFLIKEQSLKKQTNFSLQMINKIMKRKDMGSDRFKSRRLKLKAIDLIEFMIQQQMVSTYTYSEENGFTIIFTKKQKENLQLS